MRLECYISIWPKVPLFFHEFFQSCKWIRLFLTLLPLRIDWFCQLHFSDLNLQPFIVGPQNQQRSFHIQRSSHFKGHSKHHTKYVSYWASWSTTAAIAFPAKLWFWWSMAICWTIYKSQRKWINGSSWIAFEIIILIVCNRCLYIFSIIWWASHRSYLWIA